MVGSERQKHFELVAVRSRISVRSSMNHLEGTNHMGSREGRAGVAQDRRHTRLSCRWKRPAANGGQDVGDVELTGPEMIKDDDAPAAC